MRSILLIALSLRSLLACLLLLALLGCLGCGGPAPIRSGTVAGVKHQSAYTEQVLLTPGTKKNAPIYTTVQHPERFILIICDEVGQVRRVNVSRDTYQRAKRGDWWAEEIGIVPLDRVPAEATP